MTYIPRIKNSGEFFSIRLPNAQDGITHKTYFVTSCDSFHESKLKLTIKMQDAVFGEILASKTVKNFMTLLFTGLK